MLQGYLYRTFCDADIALLSILKIYLSEGFDMEVSSNFGYAGSFMRPTEMSSSVPTMPPVVATAPPYVYGSFSDIYSVMIGGGGYLGSGPGLGDVDVIEPDGPITVAQDRAFLALSPKFNTLPEDIRNLLLQSDRATTQMAAFLRSGGDIVLLEGLGSYNGRYDPNIDTIYLDKGTIDNIRNGLDTESNAEKLMMFGLAHELGHFVQTASGLPPWNSYGNEDDWADYRAQSEALANVNGMLISNEIQSGDPDIMVPFTGYASDGVLRPMWDSFLVNHDLDALVESMKGLVSNSSWGGPDLNGDGVTNQVDRFIQEFRAPRP